MYNTKIRGPLIEGNKSLGQITREVVAPLETKSGLWWTVALGLSSLATIYGIYAVYITVYKGIGTWGVNNSVGWGWEIINFVWWIGIGHAGTAFSIFLLILRQRWRTSINRSAEAMTVFAVLCAAIMPALHMGRIWLAFYIFPYPNTRGPLWVNFNSPLFLGFYRHHRLSSDISFILVSWNAARSGNNPRQNNFENKKSYIRFLQHGWTGSSRQWIRFESLVYLLGGIAAVLVVSVHSIVSTDFAVGVEPGWHTTIFPPFFVVGAIFSGFAMVMTLMVLIRKIYRLTDYITDNHMDAIARILIFISLIMGTAYLTEVFVAWYSGNKY